MKVLLLGSTGLLGHNVLLRLLDGGHSVVALVRNADVLAKEASNPALTLLKGSLIDANVLRQALDGCDAIVNCAGTTDMSLLRYEDYLPVNRDLPMKLLQLMDELQIRSLVHVSTANTVGNGTTDSLGIESGAMQPPFSRSYYAMSKAEAEHILTDSARKHPDRHIVIVNPGFIVGPYDIHPSSGRLLLAAYNRRLMAVPRGGKSFVHVYDVAQAVVNAVTMGRNGERYLLTGTNMSLRDFYALQSRVCGYKQRIAVLPNWMVGIAGYVGDFLRLMHVKTQLATRNVRLLMPMEYYSNEKARRELQMPDTHVETAIADFFYWYKNRTKQQNHA